MTAAWNWKFQFSVWQLNSFPLPPPVLETLSLQLEPSRSSGKQGWLHVRIPHLYLLLSLRSRHRAPENDDTLKTDRKQMVLLQHLKELLQVKSSGSGEKVLKGFGQVGRTPFCSLHSALWPMFLHTIQRPVLSVWNTPLHITFLF